MTAIGHFIPGSRRPGALGVHSLDGFAVTVPDLRAAETFYRTFGLDLKQEANGFGVYTEGSSHKWISVVEASKKRLHHLSFGAFEEDMPGFQAKLNEFAVERLDPPPGLESNGFWFRDPDGMLVEIRVAEKTSPTEKTPIGGGSVAAGDRGAPKRSKVKVVKPRRLAHLLIFTRDVGAAIRFYSNILGLRLSDRSGDAIAFMHGVHGSDHHVLAFVKSEGPGLHHSSWDVGSIQEVGLGAMQMADKGFSKGWGLGRHVLGSNYFHYIRDPWGSYAEYSCDMDYIPVNVDWDVGDHEAEDAFYVWGPEPPPDFGENKEL
ncbi:MAG TPA: VOC family protein [Roseiarcus sp.]|nr:VOC family protein [Roseiarcus sp.]